MRNTYKLLRKLGFLVMLLSFFAINANAQYCTVGINNACDEYISDVQVASITNPSDCPLSNGYSDYTAVVIPMSPGTAYPITVLNGLEPNYTGDECGIWIDWNQDGDFDDADETITITSGSPGGGPYLATITPPAGATPGTIRMRVRIVWTTTGDLLTPCGFVDYGETEDYTIDLASGSACIDPPTAGITVASSNPICPSDALNLSLQGNSIGSGQSYQWQSSTDGVNWNPIIGASNATYSTTQTSDTYYRCLVTCGASSVPSDFVLVIANPPTQCYCTAGITFVPFDEYISDVQVAGITNPTGGTPGGYTDYTSIVIPMSIGTDHPITVINGLAPNYAADQCAIWVDWNQDGDFDDVNEAITVAGNPSAGPYTSVINPPAGSPLGTTRMRVRINWNAAPPACGITTYGDTEDYTIDVQPAPSCPFATNILINNITTTSADIDWADGATAVGYEIRWKAVADLATVPTWATPTATVTSNYSIAGLLPQTMYEVQISVDCGGGDMSGFSFSYMFETSCGLTVCPVGANTESEVCGDDLNGGCNMATPLYEPIACGETVCGTSWSNGTDGTRDTDWFTFTLTQPSTVTWSVDADFPSLVGFVDPSAGCGAPVFFNLSQNTGECSNAVSVQNLAAGTWWLFVANSTFDDAYNCTSGKNKYIGTLTCAPLVVAANDECSGAISLVQDLVCTPTAGSVADATQSLPGCAAGSTANNDVWYSFVATSVTAQVIVAGSTDFDAVVEVFDACAGVSLGCTDGTLAGETETATVTGLTIGNTYYVRVYDYNVGEPLTNTFDICVIDPGNIVIMNNNNDEITCSAQFYDSGGLGGVYQNGESYTKTIYPDSPNSLVQVLFNSFQTEANWDGLLIYNGPNTASPLIPSGLPAGFAASCPVNSFYGATSPGIVTSTDVTGALTFVWGSDGSGQFAGWDATIGCISSLMPPNCAANIAPVDLSVGVNPNPILSWTAGAGTPPTGYDVYFGTAPNPPIVSTNQAGTSYSPGLLSFSTVYYWSVVPVNANGPAVGCTEQSFTTNATVVYCAPTSTFCEEHVSNVVVGTINNPSACTPGGYQDYSAISTDVYQGLSYPITIDNGAPFGGDQCGIWVDWNQDGDFVDANEVITVIGTPGNGPYNANIDVPVTANLGLSKIRIRITWTGILDPCGNANYGETEDYTFNVLPEPFCAYPGGLTVNNLGATSADLDWNDVPSAVTYLVRYKLVTDLVTVPTWATPTVVTAPTSNLLIGGLIPDADYEFQVQTDCGSTPFGFSTSQNFHTMPLPCTNTVCPVGAIAENENCGDDTNGGCNMTVPNYEPIACGETVCATSWSSNALRDTDWYTFTLAQASTVTWNVEADFPALIGFVDASAGCGAPAFFNLAQNTGECTGAVSVQNLAAGTWWLFVAPSVFDDAYACGSGRNNYVGTVTCTPLLVADNDECATAMPLIQTLNCQAITDSVANATQSLAGCAGTANDDVWFSFVATSTDPIIEVVGSANFDAVVEIFDACGGVSLNCIDNTLAGEAELGFLTGLTVGNTYYVRVYDWFIGDPATNSFTICVHDNAPCANTVCPASAIQENEICGDDLNGGCNMATPFYTAISCGDTICGTAWADGATRDTDWFTFTLTQPSTVTWTVNADFPMVMGFVDASQGCAAPQFFNLSTTSGLCGSTFSIDNLAAGTWWTFLAPNAFDGYPCGGGRNNFVASLNCVPLVTAVNDDCAGALPIVWNPTCVATAGTVDNATQSLTSCAFTATANDDVWYSFVATNTDGVVEANGSTSFDPAIEVFDACGGISVGCYDNTTALNSNETGIMTGLVIGNTYYVRVFDAGLGIPLTTGFDICVHDVPPPPVNDDCAGAIPVGCNTPINGTTAFATDDLTAPTCTTTITSPGIWYSVVGNGGSITASLCGGGTSYDSKLNVYSGDCANLICVGGNDDFCGLQSQYTWTSTIGVTYYILVQGYNGETGAFVLNVTTTTPATPVVTASGATTLCSGSTIDLTSSAASGNVWSNGETTQVITVGASGDYSTTVTDGNGCSATSNVITIVTSAPPTPVITSSGSTICEGDTVDLSISWIGDISWMPNLESTEAIQITAVGTTDYSVIITDALGCTAQSAIETVTINATPVAQISANGPTTVCGAGSSVELTATGGDTYLWNDGITTTSIITATVAGDYFATVSNANGCSAVTATLTVGFFPAPATPIVTASGATTFCDGGNVTLTSSAANSYDWGNGSTAQDLVVATSGSYAVTTTDTNGCTAVSAIEVVTVNANPVVSVTANGATTFCNGGSVDITSSEATGNLWSNGLNSQTISVTSSGVYSTTVTDANGCSGISNAIAVTVNTPATPVITANGPLALCNGATVDLTSSTANDITWSTGSTNQTITVSTAGTFTVTVFDIATGCSSTSASVTTTVGAGATPYIIVGGPTVICEGESVQLLSSETSGNVWSSGETTNDIAATATGIYSVTVTYPGGCTATSIGVPVVVNPLPTASFTYTSNLGGLVTFTNTSTDFVTSQWNYGDGTAWSNNTNPTHTYVGDGVFTVVLTVGNDCGSVTINQQVSVLGTGLSTLADGSTLDLYPNPTTDAFTLTFNGSKTHHLGVRVVDVTGKVVFNDGITPYNGQYKNQIDLSTHAKGVYFIQLITDEGTINRKVVLH